MALFRMMIGACAVIGLNAATVMPVAAQDAGSGVYSSHGDCARALTRLRNDQRRTADVGDYLGYGNYNVQSRLNYGCVEIDTNVWIITRIR